MRVGEVVFGNDMCLVICFGVVEEFDYELFGFDVVGGYLE